jgi:DNA-binding beta-propeller fold protein YncE
MTARTGLVALTLSALLSACGGSGAHRPKPDLAPVATTLRAAVSRPATARAQRAGPQALVTAETENRLLVVDLPSGRVVGRVRLPADPEDIAADTGSRRVVVVSARAGKVTLLERPSLRAIKVFHGFAAPHIVAVAPNGAVYVTDDARGTVTVIDPIELRATSTVEVGAGAHHLSFDLRHHRAWVALGESARRIVILDTSNFDRPRVIGGFDPGFPVHDLAFSPDGRRVWVTSAAGPDVAVFSADGRALLFRVPVGAPPQHVALDGRYAYLTSGYGSTIEKVDATGRLLARAASPYGSFELAAGDGYVVTASLLRGTLAIYTPRLKLLRVVHLAPATREVAISPPV